MAPEAAGVRAALASQAPALASPARAPHALTLRWALLALLVLWALLCTPWFVGGLVIPWDAKNHFYPMLRFLAAALHGGESVAWAPYHFAGHPQLADPQSLIFSPMMLALAALDPAPGFGRADAAVLASLLPGGIGMLLLFRSRGWRLEGGLVAALAFMFGGAAAARLQHVGMVLSYGLIPLALWLLAQTLARRPTGQGMMFGAAFGVVAGIMAAGRDQIAFLACLILVGYAVHALVTAPARLAFLRGILLPAAVAALTGALVLGVPVLLTADLAAMSNRPSIGYDLAVAGSLTPWSLVTLLVPDFYGTLGDDYWGPGALAWGVYDNQTDRAINYLYLGAVPAVLCVWHGIAGGRLAAREVRFYVFVFLAVLVYALGHYTPLFRLLFALPGVDLYRRPADAVFPLGFALSILAGYLVHRLFQDGPPRVAPLARALAAAALAGLGVAILVFAGRHGKLGIAAPALGWAAAFGAAAMAAILVAGRRRSVVALLPLVALLALDLARHNAGIAINARSAAEYAEIDPRLPNPVADFLRRRLAADAEAGHRHRVEMIGLGGPWQNAAMIYRLENTLGYNPVRLADYDRATGAGEASHLPRRFFTPLFPGYRSRLADLLGIRYIAAGAPLETIDRRVQPGEFPLLAQIGGVRIYENPRALPRVLFAPEIAIADTAGLIERGMWPAGDPARQVVLDRRPPEWRNTVPLAIAGERSTAAIERYGHHEVVIRVEARRPGMLVLNDPFHPDWHATIDESPAAIYRANAIFRAVYVPPGVHMVRFTFRPLAGLWARLRARPR